MRWNFIIYFISFFQIFVIYKALDMFYERRFRFKYSVELSIGLVAIILCIIKSGYTIDTGINMYVAFYILSIIISIIIFRGNIISKIVTYFLCIAIIGVSELVSVSLMWLIAGIDLNSVNAQSLGNILAMVLSQTLILYIYMIMKKRVNKDKMNLNINIYYFMIGLIMIFTVSIILIVIWMYGNFTSISSNESMSIYLVLLTLCVSLLSIFSIVLIGKIINDMEKKYKLDLEFQHFKLEQQYFYDVNSTLEEIRILRHDMRGELAIIHGYNELNQKDKIRSHIEKKLRELNVQLVPKIDNDNVITSYLNFKVKEAQQKGINVQVNSNFDEDSKIYIDKEDICRVLNNIMNNAIEANEDCSEKYINIDLLIDEDYIFITSENSYDNTVLKIGNKIITRKNDKTQHGYGLKSIKGITDKYNGHFNIDYDDKTFYIEIDMLNKA